MERRYSKADHTPEIVNRLYIWGSARKIQAYVGF